MKRIFMVEDNDDHALLIRKGIEDGNCAVAHYRDGVSFLKDCEEIQAHDLRPDLILLDLKLPGMDGFEVLKHVKAMKAFEQVPVVMLTTSQRREEVERAYQLGAAGYVVKSDDFGTLVAKLKCVKDYWFHTVETLRPEPVAKVGRP